jgi:hypothetical protein
MDMHPSAALLAQDDLAAARPAAAHCPLNLASPHFGLDRISQKII